MKTSNKGFTILELLIVIVVIGILAALVITGFGAIQERSRNAVFLRTVKQYETALLGYRADNG